MDIDQGSSYQPEEFIKPSITRQRQLLFTKRYGKTLIIIFLLFFGLMLGYRLGFADGTINALLHPTPTAPSATEYSYPAFLVSTPPDAPQAGLPYTAKSVYDAILASGIKTHDVRYTNGWSCCVSYEPEGKMIFWSETDELDVVEIAVFATPAEAKQVITELVKSAAGFSATSKNLCLLYYRSSISKAHISNYMKALAQVCH